MKTFYTLIILALFGLKSYANNGFTVDSIPSNILLTSSYKVSDMAFDNNGKKYFSTNTSGLVLYNGSNWTCYNTTNSNIHSNSIYKVVVDANHNCWLLDSLGLIYFDGTTFTYNVTPFISSISSMLKEKNGTIYISRNYSGFSKFSNGIFTNFTTSNSALANDTVIDLDIDVNNNLWLATNSGVSKFDGIQFTTFNTTNSNLAGNIISSVYCLNSDVWLKVNLGNYNTEVEKINNDIVYRANQLFDSPFNIYSYFSTKTYLSKMPNNGIIFPYKANQLAEIKNGKLKIYFGTDKNIFKGYLWGSGSLKGFNNSSKIELEVNTGVLWIIGNIGQLYKFKLSDYNGFASGYNGQNFKTLDVNKVKAGIMNRGDMFWDIDAQIASYEIPKGSGRFAVFANALWMGGIDAGGALHAAAQTYRQTGVDYWPGPLDTIAGTIDTATYIKYDKIWKVDRFYIEQFKHYFQTGAVQNGTWVPGEDFLTWPARGTGNYTRSMAPFVDVNNNGIYDPLVGGDYPKIKGDQMLYWIFNDNFAPHTETGGTPLKVEVHASAYAFTCPNASNADSAINYTTFYNYKVFNRNNVTYYNCYIGNWTDYDLGNANDDAAGCNPSHNISYYYNFDNDDETSIGYGLNPPMAGNIVLNGPDAISNDGVDNDNDGTIDEAGEKCLMTSNMVFQNNSTPQGNPGITYSFPQLPYFPYQYYNYLKSNWKDNSHLTYGGNGADTTKPVTNFMYPSTPPFDSTSWNNAATSDLRNVQGTGPFTFAPGTSFDYDFAIVFARNDTAVSPSATLFKQLFDNADSAKVWFDNNTFPSCLEINAGINETKKDEPNKLFVFPNPAQNTISFQLEKSNVVVAYNIYNMLGEAVITNNFVGTNSIDISELNNGVYFLSIKTKNGKLYSSKFVKR